MSRVGGIEPEAGFKGERARYFLHFTCHTTKEIYPVDVLICGRGARGAIKAAFYFASKRASGYG
jgi:hypothetical protein